MSKKSLPVLLLLLASGCGAMHDSIARANDGLYQGGAASRKKIAGWIYDDNGQPLAQAPDPTRYCYNVRSDILCYEEPREGMEGTIVGAQAQGYGNNNVAPRSRYNGLQNNPIEDSPPMGAYRDRTDIAGSVASDSNSVYVPAPPVVAGYTDSYSGGIRGVDSGAPQTLIDR